MSDFSKNMNPPEEGWNRIADKKILSDGQVLIRSSVHFVIKRLFEFFMKQRYI